MKTKAQISCAVNCTADQRLCFHYKASTITLLLKSEISKFKSSSVTVQASLYGPGVNPEDQNSRVAAHI